MKFAAAIIATAAAQLTMDDVSNMITVTIDKQGVDTLEAMQKRDPYYHKAFENSKAWDVVEKEGQEAFHAKPTQDLIAFDRRATSTPLGKALKANIEDAVKKTIAATQVNEQAHTIHIDNSKAQYLEKEWDQVEQSHDKFKARFEKQYEAKVGAVLHDKEFLEFKQALEKFSKTPLGQKVKGEVHQLKSVLLDHVTVSDKPKH